MIYPIQERTEPVIFYFKHKDCAWATAHVFNQNNFDIVSTKYVTWINSKFRKTGM